MEMIILVILGITILPGVLGILIQVIIKDGGCKGKWYKIHDYRLMYYTFNNNGCPIYTTHLCTRCNTVVNIEYDTSSGEWDGN